MRELLALLHSTGDRARFALLLLLRCPFDALHTALQALFLCAAFQAVSHADPAALRAACVWFGCCGALLFAYNGSVWALFTAQGTGWVARMRGLLFERIAGLSLALIEARPSGAWITCLSADVSAATALFNEAFHLPHTASSLVNIVSSGAVLLAMDPLLLPLILLFVLPHMYVSWRIARPMTGLAAQAQEATAHASTNLAVFVECAETAAVYNAGGLLMANFEKSSLQLMAANMRMRMRTALGAGLLPLMGMAGYLTVMLASAGSIASGDMSFGALAAAFQFRGGVLMGAMTLSRCLPNIKAAMAGVGRVRRTICMPSEEEQWTNT